MARERLIQETIRRDYHYPWKMLVACVLLNRSRGDIVGPVFEALMRRWPSPGLLVCAPREDLAGVIQPCGLQNVKADRILKMTADVMRGKPLNELRGVGRYGRDSYRLFVVGETSPLPQDAKLFRYAIERKNQGRKRRVVAA